MRELSDAQWCFLDLLIRAKRRGVSRVNRLELLASAVPAHVKVQLVFAALTMPGELVILHGQHDFEITEAGERLFDREFGQAGAQAEPTKIADLVIALPDPSTGRLQ